MMLDANIVATSPFSVWRVLGQAGLSIVTQPSTAEAGASSLVVAHR